MHHTGAQTGAVPPPDSLARQSPEGARGVPHTVAGKLAVHDFESKELGSRRRLFVLLPPHYETEPLERYPVVYAQDGQNLFDSAAAAGAEEWGLDELLQAEPSGVAAVIVVGIEASPKAMTEYAPPGSRDDARGDVYVRLLVREVKPFIEARYRTKSGARNALLLGEGVGSLVSLYGAWAQPDVFGAAIALDLPDVDARSTAWSKTPPARSRPRLWVEQRMGNMARTSTTALLADLRAGAEVSLVVAGPRSNRLLRLTAALRALLPPD